MELEQFEERYEHNEMVNSTIEIVAKLIKTIVIFAAIGAVRPEEQVFLGLSFDNLAELAVLVLEIVPALLVYYEHINGIAYKAMCYLMTTSQHVANNHNHLINYLPMLPIPVAIR